MSLVPFSVSHAGDDTLIGVGCDGIDLAWTKGSVDREALGALAFTPEERRAMTSDEDFFRAWTQKEAVIKAEGSGFFSPWLARRIWPEPEDIVARHFQVLELPDPEPGFVAALAQRIS